MKTREELIEEAAKAIFDADPPNNPHGPASDLVFDEPYTRGYSANLRIHARAALAVFEKAHTPTDDEREALAEVIARERRGWERNGGRVDSMTLRDAILAAGFRRSENPEQLV